MNKKILGVFAGILAGLLWGAWMPITKYGISSSLNINDLIFLRFFVAAIIALPFLFKYGFIEPSKSYTKTATLVFSSGIGYVVIASFGFAYAPASYASTLPVSMIFFSTIISLIIYRKKFTLKIILSLLFILFGFIMFLMQFSLGKDISIIIGLVLFTLAGLSFAIYNVVAKHWSIPPFHAVSLVSFYSFIIFFPWYLQSEKYIFEASAKDIIFQMFYQGILVSFVALLAFSYAGQKLGATKAALFAILMPVLGVLLSRIFLHEDISNEIYFTLFLMIVGMAIGVAPSKNTKIPTEKIIDKL
ncbi:MAG: hypothetical protein COA66_07815 [Arcobacter sp.]|nr:MAG: hypothetical protein COA66_07815 [Arcobacter sp.]